MVGDVYCTKVVLVIIGDGVGGGVSSGGCVGVGGEVLRGGVVTICCDEVG